MKLMKYIFGSALVIAIGCGFASCSEDDLGESIFDTTDGGLDPDSYTYNFDKWLLENYTQVYNLDFCYKMKDIATDMDYNLVPATYDKSVDLAVLTKYLWFDVYRDLVGVKFLQQYGPRIIHLIGSTAINPASQTEILGLAEGGLKVSLFRVNLLDTDDFEQLNEKYFKTMHHEFAHILHQTKTYPKEFDLITASHYEPFDWQSRNGGVVASLGFTTNYASSQAREDFAETIANYITRTDDQWNLTLWMAERNWKAVDESEEYAFCYWYYANEADEERGYKTYFGLFRDADGVYEIQDATALTDEEGSMYDENGGTYGVTQAKNSYTDVASFEARLEELRAKYTVHEVENTDQVDGQANMLQKLSIAREWFKSAWGLDIDALRNEVQTRQVSFDINELRKDIDNPSAE